MKNKRGFTLIELLAIIVILAVIAVITVPIVLNIIENSKKGAAQNSALGYKDAIHKYYASRLSLDSNFIMADHVYEIAENGYLSYIDSNNSSNNIVYEVLLDGKAPTGGFVQLEKNRVSNACINFDEYAVLIEEGSISDTIKGECVSVSEVSGNSSQLAVNTEFLFPYVSEGEDKEQVLEIAETGYYKLEVWGASGGSASELRGGYGGYSSGVVHLTKGEILYINVGGQGADSIAEVITTNAGGYNGGANGYVHRNSSGTSASGGGGATHIALSSGTLASFDTDSDGIADADEIGNILIVAGGGGGTHRDTDSNGYSSIGGSGGGHIGGSITQTGSCSNNCMSYSNPSGGTQSSGGYGVTDWAYGTSSSSTYVGRFGVGGTGTNSYGGGGGGFYGGASGQYNGAGGGSGYIRYSGLYDGVMYCYGCSEASNFSIRTFSTTGSNKDLVNCPDSYSNDPLTNCAKSGDGYAKVTYIGRSYVPSSDSIDYFNYEFINSDEDIYHTFIASKSGYYKFEAWGAQGGDSYNGQPGGKGGYTSGILQLDKNDVLYVYVGGQNGYNGGGTNGSGNSGGVGGGASDIRILPKSDTNTLASRIMVAGGGGGAYNWSSYNYTGGVGGGLTGGAGSSYNTCQSTGGTQVAGGTCSWNSAVNGSFGIGGNGDRAAAGGGGGYYGGAGRYDYSGSASVGGGGSSYVSGYTGCIAIAGANSITARSVGETVCQPGTTDPKCSYHYLDYVFSSAVIIDGASIMPSKDDGTDVTGNSGNGRVKITYIGTSLN